MATLEEILELLKGVSDQDKDLVTRAYEFAQEAHKKQKRYSGEPYFLHVSETAKNLAEFGMGAVTISAGLLHDVIEDAEVSKEEMREKFGDEILFLIDGVTKIGKLKYRGVERHAESLRKLFIATAKDIRVIMIRLADRLHNMKTLEHVPAHKRKRIAQETLQIYTPIAHRLGIGRLRGQLEDLAFPYVHPEKYKEVLELRKQKSKETIKRVEKVSKKLKKELAAQKIEVIKTDYRMKHLYSLYKKLLKKDMNIDKVYDIAALRVIVPTVVDCYKALGIIHGIWTPLPGRIKDYIASPKINGYQSIHTTVFTGDGFLVEIQVRTPEMHREAEFGVAAHVSYKNGKILDEKNTTDWVKKILEPFLGGETSGESEQEKAQSVRPAWLSNLIEAQEEVSDPEELLGAIQTDFFDDRVFVFTPNGDVIDLPEGSTPVDFAFAVHTDIGSHMAGAKINGKLSSLETALASGDIVEIVTKNSAHPTPKWLEYAKTSLARRKIRNSISGN
jgi:GTP pyrophosphokinase